MDVAWKIDVLAEGSQRSTRIVHCLTELLDDPISRYQIEMLTHLGFRGNSKLKRFRPLFVDRDDSQPKSDMFSIMFIDDYWEDPEGNEVGKATAWKKLFNIPNDSLQLVSTEPHWIKLQIGLANRVAPFGAEPPQISADQRFVLHHFSRDTLQLGQSKFMTNPSPFSLSGPADQPLHLQTLGLEHIGHFISVFRRVFADKEPAGYKKFCNVVQMVMPGTLFGEWLIGERAEINKYLSEKATSWLIHNKTADFNRDQLINNFMYGQFLHQPDKEKEAVHAKWAKQVGGPQLLEAVFYETAMTISAKLINWGRWARGICQFANISLNENSAGTLVSSPHPVDNRPERVLSADQLRHFEEYAAELGACLRDKDEPSVRTSASTYLERARNHLREIL